jgi:hypothetical protein
MQGIVEQYDEDLEQRAGRGGGDDGRPLHLDGDVAAPVRSEALRK